MKDMRDIVRDKYGKIAMNKSTCCGPVPTCCGPAKQAERISKGVGYSEKELKSVPDEANLGLGCGNPTALAPLKEGEVVLDFGSGGGMDCFLQWKRWVRRARLLVWI